MNNQSDGETGVKHINVINMYDTDKIHPEKLAFSNYEEDAVKKCNVEFGDIFLTRSSLKPEGIAEANVLLNSGRFVYDDHLIRVKVNKEKYDPFFVKLNLSGNAFKRQFIVRAKTTAFTTIGQEDISECLGSFPKKEEQQQIGECFMVIDHLITLHQRKYLQKKKTSLTWEQRKLSDVVDSVDTGKSKFDKEGSSGEYPILGSTSVIGYDDEYDYEGDFILSARVGANAGSLYRHAGKVKISDNTVFIQASQNIEFLYQLLIRFDIKRLSFGTGQPLVKASELKRLELMMPTDMEEQIRIGVYFKNLDHLITLHRRAHFHRRRRTYK